LAQRKKKKQAGGGSVFTVLLVGTVLAIFALPLLIVFVAGMIPTAVAAIVDRDPEKLAAIAVGPLNFAGTLPIMLEVMQNGNDMGAMGIALGSPFSWLVMYGAAGMGWLLYMGLPAMTSNVVAKQSERQIDKLIERQRELVREWGPEVASGDLDAPEPPSNSAAAEVDKSAGGVQTDTSQEAGGDAGAEAANRAAG